MTVRILVPSGVLGLGFSSAALQAGLARQPDIIAIDGGSTDSGPFYLGTGTSKYSASICRAEWKQLMLARAQLNIPLVIGSCGTCGTNGMVDWMYEMTKGLAVELGQSVTIARVYAERDPADIAAAFSADRLTALEPAPLTDAETIKQFSHIVSLAGVEPLQQALSNGADIILAGRTTDTAVIAALPLMRGAHAGASWHGAKIAECGAFCSSHPATGVILLEVDETGFTVEAMAAEAACTPQLVSAHMLYENADPFILHEPGGYLDVTAADYTAIDERRVRVEGSRWVQTSPYTVKLEAAMMAGYQTSMLAVIRDARYVANARIWADKLVEVCKQKIDTVLGLQTSAYSLEVRLIGVDGALGRWEQAQADPLEIGVLVLITANEQETATEIAQLINPYLLHLALTEAEDMPTFAFPYSPAHSERGPVFEFCLNHVLTLDSPLDGFNVTLDRT